MNRKAASPADKPENAVRFLRQLKETGQPAVLTINGKFELVVQDPTSFQQLLELVDRLETIQAIRDGLQEIDEGKGVSLKQARDEVARKYGLPH